MLASIVCCIKSKCYILKAFRRIGSNGFCKKYLKMSIKYNQSFKAQQSFLPDLKKR